ncbi:nuclear transport factor 2 family protein [Dietzia aurantiaca]|uniref:limonene-1,2-epoxide hydrolase family protein n=1 Tax=Dietzia aurantiaca TaxID=983873 RepID=UPI001E628F60|nr:limonene-1,2-epoxide hydrolase family protein [Dietzia aurantiaca]MCD2261392.1 nuclear transport factor 2 family protein [Dietzia aurantiaca]
MAATTTATDPDVVVRMFFDALASGSTAAAAELVSGDVWWANIGLPTVRGKRAVVGAIAAMHRSVRFGVRTHHLAVSAPADPTDPRSPHVVLTERTDSLGIGRFRCDFWVCGRLEVRDGLVCGWQDYFSTADIARGAVRGLVGMIPGRRVDR